MSQKTDGEVANDDFEGVFQDEGRASGNERRGQVRVGRDVAGLIRRCDVAA